MISEIDTSSVVDETESTKVTTESQMAECSTELMRRPGTGRAAAPPSPVLAVPHLTATVKFGTARRGLGGAAARPGPSSLY